MSANPPGPARLEAFSDGVIAVIITVMVLEIKVPRADGFAGLRQLVPGLLIYLLSFSFTGIYWLNHQLWRGVSRRPGMSCSAPTLVFSSASRCCR
jgi:uncharacterized membrane protein